MISFLITAKNCEKYILQCLNSILEEKSVKLEIILIIDEESNILIDLVNENINDDRLLIIKNIGVGKIIGLNYAYTLSNGDFFKCVDADDILCKDYFSSIADIESFDSHLHAAIVVDDNLNEICNYSVNYDVFNSSYETYTSKLLSVPKWCWTFNKTIADKLFPLPVELPFEDVWMGLKIKKYSRKIGYSTQPFYLYRQHKNQTFGGLLNFDINVLKFRANRMIKLIEIINFYKDEILFINNKFINIMKINNYYEILSTGNFQIKNIFSNNLSFESKLKLFILLRLNNFVKLLIIMKFKFDEYKNKTY